MKIFWPETDTDMSLEDLAKSGAVVSSVGVALMITFVIVLLVFPVNKNCADDDDGKCSYQSTAPMQLQSGSSAKLSCYFAPDYFRWCAPTEVQ